MKIINHSILGSGLSALVKDINKSNSTIFSNNNDVINKSYKFYEYQKIGGNSNIWGGYVNFERYKYLLKNKKYRNFMKYNPLFEVKEFIDNKNLNYTHYLSEKKNGRIFRVKNSNFKSKIIDDKILKLIIEKNKIILKSKKKNYKTKFLSICIGNLGLIELLHNSKLIKGSDVISFYDGICSYNLNLFLNHNKSYYIPMTLGEISKKLIYGKIIGYKKNISNTLIVQEFPKSSFKNSQTVNEILKFKSNHIRFFLSNHPANLKINNVPIKRFIKNISTKIHVYCSGMNIKYRAGPISQDIIFNALIK